MEFPENLKDPKQWVYRGEGGATIVVASKLEDIVLRLKKTSVGSFFNASEPPTKYLPSIVKKNHRQDEQTLNSVDFQKNVFQPLMGCDYVRIGSLVKIPVGFLTEINRLCLPNRPLHRLDKVIDLESNVGVFMPDFCFLQKKPGTSVSPLTKSRTNKQANHTNVSKGSPTFCVEIKPKCGYLPESPFISSEHNIKYTVCHYCMLQKLKVKEGKYSRESCYCPLDLFSEDTDRVFFALKSLVRDPQNNLRVFKDGSLIFSEELVEVFLNSKGAMCSTKFLENALHGLSKSSSSACCTGQGPNSCCLGPNCRHLLEILLQIFVHDSSVTLSNVSATVVNHFSHQKCKKSKYEPDLIHQANEKIKQLTFQGKGVLQKLLAIQQLDSLDIEALHCLYSKVMKCFSKQPKLRENLGVDGHYDWDIWKSAVGASKASLDGFKVEKKDYKILHESVNESSIRLCRDIVEDRVSLEDDSVAFNFAILKIFQFLIASTAKDCSIMITFQKCFDPPFDSHWIKEISSGDLYCYNIDLVDLDPKEFDRVPKYFKDSVRAVQNYI